MGQKDYNRQRICYNIIFVMLYSLKPGKHGLFYIYKNHYPHPVITTDNKSSGYSQSASLLA